MAPLTGVGMGHLRLARASAQRAGPVQTEAVPWIYGLVLALSRAIASYFS